MGQVFFRVLVMYSFIELNPKADLIIMPILQLRTPKHRER